MKKAEEFVPFVQTHIPDWLREMWEVEAQHSPMVGHHFKFLLPPARKRRRGKAAKKTKAPA